MDDTVEPLNAGSDLPSGQVGISGKKSTNLKVCLVGGEQIVRSGIELLLADNGIGVAESYEDVNALADRKGGPCDAVVLILASTGPFRTFQHVRDLLGKAERATPLVVLTDKTSRGQIYTALRMGAKAYVNLDASPTELVKAIEMAASNKVYLAPDATELLANDISSTGRSGTASRPKVGLSPREVEIVQLLCEGHISKEIARQLHISAKTVENHRYNIYRKCEVDNIARLIRHAIQHGMVSV